MENEKEVSVEVHIFENEKSGFFHYTCNVEDLDKVVSNIKQIKKEFNK